MVERKEQGVLPWNAVPRRRAADWLMYKLRLPVIIATTVCSLGFVEPGYAAPPPAKKITNSRKLGLNIRVQGGGWGQADREQIETVLYSVADELMLRLPKKLSAPIVVTHTESNPIALYDRGPNGEYLVRLHATGEDWQFYVYEFAHELCHILSNYEENIGADTTKYNQWFEETLCETASLYTLKSLAATWETSPPGPGWSAQAPRLHRFFDLLVNEGHRRLPPHSPLAAWLRDNEDALKHNPYLRQKNEVVANLLLPLFASRPDNWDALTYLNLNPTDARASLQQYLDHWYANAPEDHKVFIGRVLALLRPGPQVEPQPATVIAQDEAGVAGKPAEGGPKPVPQPLSEASPLPQQKAPGT